MVVTCSCVTTGTDTFAPLPLTAPEWSPKPSGRSECPSHTGAAGTAVTCRAVVRPIRRPFRPRRSHSLVGPGRRPGHRGEKGRRHQSKRGRGGKGCTVVTFTAAPRAAQRLPDGALAGWSTHDARFRR
jgi:hypothetical protein